MPRENIVNEAMSEDALRAMLTGQLAQIADIIDTPDDNTVYIGLRKPNPTDAEIASDAIWAFIKLVTVGTRTTRYYANGRLHYENTLASMASVTYSYRNFGLGA